MITASEWKAYNDGVAAISDSVEREVIEGILAWHAENPEATIAESREYAKLLMNSIVESYDSLSASFAATWYDYQAGLNGARLDQAITATVYAPKSVDEVARYQAKKLVKGDFEGFAKACGEYARNDALRSLNETIMANAKRDRKKGVRFARVTTGHENCVFCLMLASRGAVYHSRKTAGEFSHFHRGCDCKVVPGFEDEPDAVLVEGHDPKVAYRQWKLCEEIGTIAEAPKLTKAAMRKQVLLTPTDKLDGGLDGVIPWRAATRKFYIPDAKISSYALSYSGDKNKTKAFQLALGFTPSDAAELVRQLLASVSVAPPSYKRADAHGARYESHIRMTGKNGKSANVLAGWISIPGDDRLRLTTCYVDK